MCKIGIILNGVTVCMGENQHFRRSILPIMQEGGLLVNGERFMSDPVLIGRNRSTNESRMLVLQSNPDKWIPDGY